MDFVRSKTDELGDLQAWLESWIFTAAKVWREEKKSHPSPPFKVARDSENSQGQRLKRGQGAPF